MAAFGIFERRRVVNRRSALQSLLYVSGLAAFETRALAQDKPGRPKLHLPDFNGIPIRSQALAPGLHLITGPGGNIAAVIEPDGVALIDSNVPPVAAQLKAAVGKLSDRPVRFLLNTHWHFDHAGGNEIFGQSGTVIVAHHNCRKRLANEQTIALLDMKFPPSPKAALPVVTFGDTGTLHHGNTVVEAFHVPRAHTDTDAAYLLPRFDVLHTGDLFLNGIYPFIDYSTGGDLEGWILGLKKVLEVAGPRTKIIPGHGPMATRADLITFRDMLTQVRDRIKPLIEQGKSLQEVIAAKPTQPLDDKWGKGVFTPDVFVQMVYEGMTAKKG
jgi:glyoxylase-like metal-dependent hydrolase (beta-lactamase superfamily II)